MPEKKQNSAASVESLQKALDALGAQMAELSARLEKLEAAGAAAPVAVAAPVAEPAPQPVVEQPAAAAEAVKPEPVKPVDEIGEDVLLALSAAIAAYLGKRPHIRAVRLLGSHAWAQQGRVFVQASHQLNVPHDA